MRSSHNVSTAFDDPNLIGVAGLDPVLRLAERAGLSDPVGEHLTLSGPGTANAALKIPALIGGMVAGADCIDDMDLLRHGGMGRLFTGVRAPSTLGTFLRTFTFGHVRQLDAVASRFLMSLTGHASVLPGADQIAYVDVDDTVKATYGYAKQGAGYGYNGIRGLNALIATCSTPLAAPVIVASRLRAGKTNSVHRAGRLIADALATANKCGATGLAVMRADSAFAHDVIAADPGRCPILGDRTHESRCDTGDLKYSAGRVDADPVPGSDLGHRSATMDLRRRSRRGHLHRVHFLPRGSTSHRTVDRAPRQTAEPGQRAHRAGRDAAGYRYHAVLTDAPPPMVDAEADHRAHAIIEQNPLRLRAGSLAHLSSGSFAANSA